MRSNSSTCDKKTDVINYPFRKIYIKNTLLDKINKVQTGQSQEAKCLFIWTKTNFSFYVFKNKSYYAVFQWSAAAINIKLPSFFFQII